uniref:CAZy families GT1 protein n=1 Tax=uncultured Aggregatibacter sp. TaxID=470564 RepID=A0A060BX13_9PAST|nr:CAZy families GT1 protein [uncultured Aggregatibacter sp.]
MPRTKPRREQILRAERLAAQGLIGMIPPDDLTPEALSNWLSGPAPRTGQARDRLDMDGLSAIRLRASALLSSQTELSAHRSATA